MPGESGAGLLLEKLCLSAYANFRPHSCPMQVHLFNLTLRNGRLPASLSIFERDQSGGAISCQESHLALKHCILLNNYAHQVCDASDSLHPPPLSRLPHTFLFPPLAPPAPLRSPPSLPPYPPPRSPSPPLLLAPSSDSTSLFDLARRAVRSL